jgi:hypothetical protein
MCLGQEDAVDLRAPLRASEGNGMLEMAIRNATSREPRGMISSLIGPIISRLSRAT